VFNKSIDSRIETPCRSTGKYRSAAPRARQLEFAKELGEKPTLVEN